MAHAKRLPAEASSQVPASSSGVSRDLKVPSPRPPSSLPPQQASEPLAPSAQLASVPATTAAAPSTPSIATGSRRSYSIPRPSSPSPPRPQQATSPSTPTPQLVRHAPAITCRHGPAPSTGTGAALGRRSPSPSWPPSPSPQHQPPPLSSTPQLWSWPALTSSHPPVSSSNGATTPTVPDGSPTCPSAL